jgi:hypothetical protein
MEAFTLPDLCGSFCEIVRVLFFAIVYLFVIARLRIELFFAVFIPLTAMPGYFPCTLRRTSAFSAGVPCCETRANAFLACALSSIGYRRPFKAKAFVGIFSRFFVVNFAIVFLRETAMAQAIAGLEPLLIPEEIPVAGITAEGMLLDDTSTVRPNRVFCQEQN